MSIVICVVVDQMGWQDRTSFPLLTKLLGTPNQVELPYFPTITETAHASISVAAPPSTHGIVGRYLLVEGPDGLHVLGINENAFSSTGYGDGKTILPDWPARRKTS